MIYDWYTHITFLYPWVLLGLLLLPFLMFAYIRRWMPKQPTFLVSTLYHLRERGAKTKLVHLPFLLRLLCIASLIIAIAHPYKKRDTQKLEGEGIDIVLCMDVSGSMNSRDILPSRMEVAKEVASQFILQRTIDRIGLVIFSGESFTLVPLTNDKGNLINQIKNLSPRKYLIDGTVMGEGLATAVSRLAHSDAKSKVVILITDGKEDPPETRLLDPYTALSIARAKKIKVYTIGMGALGNAPSVGERKNANFDFLDEKLLTEIAEQTGGAYFRATSKTALEDVYSQIDSLEKSKIETTIEHQKRDGYWIFLFFSVGFLFVELLLKYTYLRTFP